MTFLTAGPSCLNSFLDSIDKSLTTKLETYGLEDVPGLSRDFRQERKKRRQSLWINDGGDKQEDNESYSALDVRFEKVLKYIEIPLLDNATTNARIDVLSIFDWLCICKGVRTILEVRVQDSRYTPHSEEDIEDSLIQLEIQELDWRRTDLSIHTILACAPDVERLHLYSSGNLATIDHWTGPNGVVRLKNVSLVPIIIPDLLAKPIS